MILEKQLELIDGDGKRTAFSIQVGQPYEADQCWKCSVNLPGLIVSKPVDICGSDSVQALCLSLGFAKKLLEGELERGNHIVEPSSNDDWPLAVIMKV